MTMEVEEKKECAPIEITWQARSEVAAKLVKDCAERRIPFSGSPDSLWAEFTKRGWSTNMLYEMVTAARRAPQ